MSYTIASPPESFLESIDNLDHRIVLRYLESINSGDFRSAVQLFERQGSLQPPLETPLVGWPSILPYLQEEYRDVEFIPEKYRCEREGNACLHITVIGKERIPWFGSTTDIDQIWRFTLLTDGSISRLAIDILPEI